MSTALRSALDAFLAEANALTKARAVAPLERRLLASVKRVFALQEAALLRRLVRVKSRFPALRESDTDEALDALIEQALSATRLPFERAIDQAAQDAFLAGAQAVIAEMGEVAAGFSFDLRHPQAEAYLRSHAAERVTMIAETTRLGLRAILRQGMENGWGYSKTARAIREKYAEFSKPSPQKHIRNRAELIAITEVGEAYEAAALLTAQELDAAGVTIEKSWLTVGDARVTAKCRANQAKGWISVDASFPSGHRRPLRFPGCRCALQTRPKE